MYLVVIAWIYVVLLMGLAEAFSPQGSWLGALMTVLLYGALPLSIVVYIMGTPARKRARLKREAAENSDANSAAQSTVAPDASRETTGDAIAPVRKEP